MDDTQKMIDKMIITKARVEELMGNDDYTNMEDMVNGEYPDEKDRVTILAMLYIANKYLEYEKEEE